jgi:glycosyltransferase involved in cell wall biosynthesis
VPDADTRPALAFLCNVPTPYRNHLHRRIALEIPQVRLHSIFTHARSTHGWKLQVPPEINPVYFTIDNKPGRTATWRPRQVWAMGSRVIRFLLEEHVRAVICDGYQYLTNRRVIRYCAKAGIPIFLRADSNIRGDRPGPARAWVKRRILGSLIRSCAGVMPMGRLGQEYFEKYGADSARCFRVPFEPDYESFANVTEREVSAFRARHEMQAGRRHILYSGRLAAAKRVDLLLDAFAAIAERRPDWGLFVAGDGPLRRSLAARVPHALAGRVLWPGFLEADEIRVAYHAADLMVLPSDYEPWALVVIEAMAAGCPVISSDVVGASAELIEDGVNGRMFRSGDLAGLTDALLQSTDPATLARYRSAIPPTLASWRRRDDPIEGVRAALRSVGVL